MCASCGCGLKDKKDPGFGKGPAKGKKAPAKKAPAKKKK